MDRRQMMQLTAMLAAARPAAGQPDPAPAEPAISKEQLTAALAVIGLKFDDAQLEMMRRSVSRSLAEYEKLRKIDVPLDTEPAFSFHPGPAGSQPQPGRARFRPTPPAALPAPAADEDLAFLPVTRLAGLLKSRRVSSMRLTTLYLKRLKQFAPKLNCVVTLTEELALRQAEQADSEMAAGKYRGPLHGIPYGLKDLFATRGIKTTWGAEPFQEQIIDLDSTVYTRLSQAGGVLVGKLSMGALAMGGQWFGGMTKTPWNLELTSSGSSAGSASATAAGLLGYAIGTETLGSIVTPSIRCGVTGLRPTYGRVSRHGAMGLSWTMDKIGPICRAVEDCALVLNALYGPDGHDRTVTAAPFHWEPRTPLAKLRVGVAQKGFDQAQGEAKGIWLQALEDLKRAGVAMTPVELPDSTAGPLVLLLNAEAACAFDDITRDGRVAQLSDQSRGAWPNSFRTSRLIPAVEYIRAQRARTLLMEKMQAAFEPFDAIVCPPYSHLTSTNLTGHPQVVVPCGFLKGLPQGLGFLGRLWDEGSPLRLALAYQTVTEWHLRRPPLK